MTDQNTTNKNQDNAHSSGNEGFASMPKEQVQDIASKGGQTSHKGEGQSEHTDNNTGHHSDAEHKSGVETHKSGNQGFASMPEDKVKDIASQGGQSS